MTEELGKTIVVNAICVIIGLYIGYSVAYHDVMTGCKNTHVVTDKTIIYSCEAKP
jgi:transposase-like protein